jgi:hypothetical protein
VKINYPITSRFLEQESFRKSGHKGIDFLFENGTELRSICNGKISKLADYGNANIGKGAFVKCEDGNTMIFGHLSKFTDNLKVGDIIHAGELIGFSGNSGHVVGENGGYHLHFGMKNGDGKFIDPSPHIEQIQHMNDKNYVYHGVGQPEVMNHSYTLQDIMSQYMKDYASMLSELKFNLINLITSIDYSMIMHYLQNLFQFFS